MLRFGSNGIFLWLLLLLIFVGGAVAATGFLLDLNQARKILLVEQHLRKLNLITLGMIRRHAPASESEVWRMASVMVPREDPWGNEYHLRGEGMDARWASAGPDSAWNSRDDISFSLRKLAAQIPENMRDTAGDVPNPPGRVPQEPAE